MAEIDEAASAFQAEIAPESATRARDPSGRFAAAPEPMFKQRGIEGDETTGDTSDGGDDPRLIERERREADGWTNERDAVPDKPARPRRPANDNQREANDNEEPPERIGEHEDDEDEAEPEGEEAPEEQGQKYQVTVDGQTVEVTLPEALKGYVREATFYQRMNKVAEAARTVEQHAAQVAQTRDEYVRGLEEVRETLSSLVPQLDWDKEFQADPKAAHEKFRAAAQIHGQAQLAAQKLQREAEARALEYDRAAEKYAHDQFPRFVQEANIQDEKTLNESISLMRNYLKHRGFHEGEIATTYDSRMMLVALDAAKYHQSLNGELPKPVQPGKGRALVPGASTPHTREVGRRSIDEAMNRLAKSGHIDDATTVFQRLIR